MSKPTHQDDCERMLRILSDAPIDGLSLDEIQAVTSRTGETWSITTINDVLCSIMGQIVNQKIRVKGGKKITKYMLKGR